jgi:hypothetical protein
MKAIIVTSILSVVVQVVALAQVPTPADDSTPIPPVTGTVTAFAADQSIEVDVAPADHRTYHLARAIAVLSPQGNLVDTATVTVGRTVTLSFMKEYDDIIVDRIVIDQ